MSVQNLQCLILKREVQVSKFCLNFCGKLLLILNYVPDAHQSEARERQEGRLRLPCSRVPLLSRCPSGAGFPTFTLESTVCSLPDREDLPLPHETLKIRDFLLSHERLLNQTMIFSVPRLKKITVNLLN